MSTNRNLPPELLAALLENPYESQVIVDAQCIVRYMSPAYRSFHQLSHIDPYGRPLLELIPRSNIPRVLTTGHAEIGRLHRMGDKERVIARIPLRDENGNIVGVVGKLMFWDPEKIKELVRQVEDLQSRLDYYEKELQQAYRNRYSLEGIVGESPPMLEARRIAMQAATSDLPVLIVGETGTGKTVFAHAIHQLSARRERLLVTVNCAAIPNELFESELFGYEAGAFTGASPNGKPGKFELADKSTIFLDEVGELPLPVQAKLLRIIEDHEVDRLGGTRTLNLDFRVIAATNRDLKDMLSWGKFRKDLYYRLNIFVLQTPDLRQIRSDIPRLAYHVLASASDRFRPHSIDPRAMQWLMAYDWPGNVRELRNVLEVASAVAGDGPILEKHLPMEIRSGDSTTQTFDGVPYSLKEEIALTESRALRRALNVSGGNRSEAARLLGIHRTSLYKRMKQYGLDVGDET